MGLTVEDSRQLAKSTEKTVVQNVSRQTMQSRWLKYQLRNTSVAEQRRLISA